MVTKGAYGQLKGRWRVLYRRNECSQTHCWDSLSRKMDLTIDPVTGERRDREVITGKVENFHVHVNFNLHHVLILIYIICKFQFTCWHFVKINLQEIYSF